MDDSTIIALASLTVTAFTAYLAYKQSRKRGDLEKELQESRNQWEKDKLILSKQFERSEVLFQREDAAMDKLTEVIDKISWICSEISIAAEIRSSGLPDSTADEIFDEEFDKKFDEIFAESQKLQKNISDYHPGIIPIWTKFMLIFDKFLDAKANRTIDLENLDTELLIYKSRIQKVIYLRRQEHIKLDYTLIDKYLNKNSKQK
jgi:hypothetical protein